MIALSHVILQVRREVEKVGKKNSFIFSLISVRYNDVLRTEFEYALRLSSFTGHVPSGRR